MPELPEVETTRCGIEPWIVDRMITGVDIRVAKLRWPIPADLSWKLVGQTVHAVERRGKYLLFRCAGSSVILHLGMSGHLRVIRKSTPPQRHDHVDIVFIGGIRLRLTDPRRFSTLLWTDGDPLVHPLLADHGPEPFSDALTGDYLFQRSRNRKIAIKSFLMDHRVVAGVGNIYANESLFRAGIHPARPAGALKRSHYRTLVDSIRAVLDEAIAAGGTSLRDFSDESGRPGYFALKLKVYDQAGKPCKTCGTPIESFRLSQRSSYFCRQCQH